MGFTLVQLGSISQDAKSYGTKDAAAYTAQTADLTQTQVIVL